MPIQMLNVIIKNDQSNSIHTTSPLLGLEHDTFINARARRYTIVQTIIHSRVYTYTFSC